MSKTRKQKTWVCECGSRLKTDDTVEWADWMDKHRQHGVVHPEEGSEYPKVVVLDDNPLSIACYLEDHPDIAKKLEEAREK